LRLNYRPNGQCKDCTSQCCVYDSVCFMCGQEGHGAFHTHPGGKHQGQLKCNKHRLFTEQLAEIKEKYVIDEVGIKALVSAGSGKKHHRAINSTHSNTSQEHRASNSSHDSSAFSGSLSGPMTVTPSAWTSGSQRLHLLQVLHSQVKDDESSYSPDGSAESTSQQQQQQKFPGSLGTAMDQLKRQHQYGTHRHQPQVASAYQPMYRSPRGTDILVM